MQYGIHEQCEGISVMKFVFNGPIEVDQGVFQPVHNATMSFSRHKPHGGVWLSDYTPDEEFVSYWIQWARSAEYPIHDHNFLYEANMEHVYVIHDYSSFRVLFDRFPLTIPDTFRDMYMYALDFESMSKAYTGIYLSPSGLMMCKHPYLFDESIGIDEPTLSMWDVPSLLVFDPSILQFIHDL
jgi:hypothetical protein